MNIYSVLLSAVLLGVGGPVCALQDTAKVPATAKTTTTAATSITCGTGLPPVSINFSAAVPYDLKTFSNQLTVDCFAWSEFVSLNWPTSGTGFGDPGDTAPVQWQSYMDAGLLFPSDGSTPPPWGSQPALPENCASQAKLTASSKRMRVFSMTGKTDSPFSTGQAAPQNAPNWLGAQNGSNAWYEITVSQDEYNYVVNNGLYNANTQASYVNNGQGSPVVLPKGCSTELGQTCPNGSMLGAVEMKAAWMEAPDYGSNPKWSRYKITEGLVIDPSTQQCRQTNLALVGLHILHKTTNQPTWVWATFEHIDNVPTANVQAPSGGYNFYNANCQTQTLSVPAACTTQGGSGTVPVTVSCTANQSPPYYLGQGCPKPVPIQVTRTTQLDSNAQTANQTVQNGIRQNYPNSVWQYYQLVDVLWSTNPTQDPSKPYAVPHPLTSMTSGSGGLVANTTLETYVQNTTCTSCHEYAAIAPKTATCPPASSGGNSGSCSSDFSFLFGQVGPAQANVLGLKRIFKAH
ncbi:cytochrome c family protein [Methylovulum psychrotolerans]|uniref:Cytochrome c family protein n=1 Tax=Methylovulum psychrotolerans TaxID=1704499 RepID=A0A1Z4C3A5_9GAMM|nr:cytochrome c family protein [Methylovulum psychrotolerans]ASF48013.1 cytochrome c family protein [Methylovulum psychrotolerans]